MTARFLFCRAAGMKNRGAFVRRDARKFQFLERARRHGGDLRPVLNDLRRHSPRPANLLVGGIVLELQREKLESEFIKLIALRLPRRSEAKARGEA